MAESDVKRYRTYSLASFGTSECRITGATPGEYVSAEDYDKLEGLLHGLARIAGCDDGRGTDAIVSRIEKRILIATRCLATARRRGEQRDDAERKLAALQERHRKLREAATKVLHEISNSPKRHFGYFTGRAVQISDDDIESFRRALEADKEAEGG